MVFSRCVPRGTKRGYPVLLSYVKLHKKGVVEGQDGDDAKGEKVFGNVIKMH